MALIDESVQIGAIILCSRLTVCFRDCRTAHADNTCPHSRIKHRCHIGEYAALPAAGQVKLGLMHTELEPFLACQMDCIDACTKGK